MGVKMLLLALFLACAGDDADAYECDMDGDGEFITDDVSPTPLGEECSKLAGAAGGGDTDAEAVLEMDPRDLGEYFNCRPAATAGEECLRVADIVLNGTE